MAITLVTALAVEGKTDERFLPIILQRKLEQIIAQYAVKTIDVMEPMIITSKQHVDNLEEKVVNLAREASGFHMLLIHIDADASSSDKALRERFDPGIQLVYQRKARGENFCQEIIPIIPVRMTEAWMLADAETLHQAIGTHVPVQSLGLPQNPHQVESLADPKEALKQAINRALADRPRRRRNLYAELVSLHQSIAQAIPLEQLDKVPAFQALGNQLHEALRVLHFID